MKKVWLLIAILGGVIAGMIAGVIASLLIPAEWRGKLSGLLAAPLGHCLEQMPDG